MNFPRLKWMKICKRGDSMKLGIKIRKLLKTKVLQFQKYFYRPKVLAKQSKKYLCSLIKKKSANTIEVIMGFGIGDALFCAAYLKSLKASSTARYLKFIAPKRLAPILKTYSFVDKYQFVSSYGKKMQRLNYILHDDALKAEALRYGIYTSLPTKKQPGGMLEYFRENVYRLSDALNIEFHNVSCGKVTAIKDFDTNYKKIVVLNPYSNSISLKMGEDELFCFEKVCLFLSERGFSVYTNVIKDQKPVKGSTELRCSLTELYSIASKIPFIVSVRSGILDFIVKTNISMFILYDGEIGKSTYSMKQWECNGIYEELLFSDWEKENGLESFKNFFYRLGL